MPSTARPGTPAPRCAHPDRPDDDVPTGRHPNARLHRSLRRRRRRRPPQRRLLTYEAQQGYPPRTASRSSVATRWAGCRQPAGCRAGRKLATFLAYPPRLTHLPDRGACGQDSRYWSWMSRTYRVTGPPAPAVRTPPPPERGSCFIDPTTSPSTARITRVVTKAELLDPTVGARWSGPWVGKGRKNVFGGGGGGGGKNVAALKRERPRAARRATISARSGRAAGLVRRAGCRRPGPGGRQPTTRPR